MSSSFRACVPGFIASILSLGIGPAADAGPAEPPGEAVINVVEGRNAIKSLKEEGSRVKTGEIVCELDSSALQEKLKSQKIATLGAEAAYKNARLTREVAEIAVVECLEMIKNPGRAIDSGKIARADTARNPDEGLDWTLETINGEVALAEAELKRAEDRLEWSNRMFRKGAVSEARRLSDELNVKQKKAALEQAQVKRDVLTKYVKDKTIKQLQREVERAKSEEDAREANYERELEAQAWLKRQVEACKVVAPIDGRVRYFRAIEEGTTVRERQLLFRVIPEE